ncbi:MAG: FadR/GntR family transcriptional regulator [Desulfobacteraceae bacterium]
MALPIRKITAAQAVVDSMKQRIRDGEFAPDAKLPSETALLKEYEVSRFTLREAIARLSALGIIQVKHGKGAYVANTISVSALDDVLIPFFPEYDHSRMNELVDARNLIEAEIASKLATKRTQQQLDHLNDLLDCDEKALEDPDFFANQDYNFHFALVMMSENQFYIAMYQALYRQIKAFLIRYAKSIDNRKEALEKHRPILAAIAGRNAALAGSLAREHAGICASFIQTGVQTGHHF